MVRKNIDNMSALHIFHAQGTRRKMQLKGLLVRELCNGIHMIPQPSNGFHTQESKSTAGLNGKDLLPLSPSAEEIILI